MPLVVGIFGTIDAIDAVVDQLQTNNISDTTLISATDALGTTGAMRDVEQQLRGRGVPDDHVAEYHERLQKQQYLLLIRAGALELPTVQRILRSNNVIDIDLLPQPGS